MTSNNTSKQSSENRPRTDSVFEFPSSEEPENISEEMDVPASHTKYEQRYIAFIDILGFKEIIRRSSSNQPEELSSIVKALMIDPSRLADDYEGTVDSEKKDLRFNTFSDFVVFSCAETPEGLDLLIFLVWGLMRDWLSKRYVSRGAVTKGQVMHRSGQGDTPGMVFGPAFVEAYLLEQEVADYPRVVLSKEVRKDCERFRRERSSDELRAIHQLIRQCEDGPYGIDLFAHFRSAGFKYVTDDHSLEAKLFGEQLCATLNEEADVPRIYRKLKWLVQQFNGAVEGTVYSGNKVEL